MQLMWFRRDFRIVDNPALFHALQHGPCRAIFIATPLQWQQHGMAAIQVDFIERHVNWLAQQLATLGVVLDYIEVADYTAQITALQHYCIAHQISNVCANSEVELNEQHRDQQLIASGLSLQLFEADVLVSKGSVLNQQGSMYKVFTPFRNAWLKQLQQRSVIVTPIPRGYLPLTKPPASICLSAEKVSSQQWPLAEQVMQAVLSSFLQNKHASYQTMRDFPAQRGTSRLSPYFAIGALSVKSVVNQLLQMYPQLLDNAHAPSFAWLNEFAWRDFYKHLLFHLPKLCRHQTFNSNYQQLPWRNNAQLFTAWCSAKTGYPLVDAAMRQLQQTGWMHNRLRMVVASFLTKHLLIDWRMGERYFMSQLIDGDFSANNGGWQWAAGTGCDAQPYFRIFNPIRQSEKFDPDGSFIRHYLPELADVPLKYLHFPHQYLAEHNLQHHYWPAIVEHKAARLEALAFYQSTLNNKSA